MDKVKELEGEIKRKQDELEKLKRETGLQLRDEAIKELNEFTQEEINTWFRTMYSSVRATLDQMEEGDWHEDNDDATYHWETCWGVLAKDKSKFNKYIKTLADY